MIAAMDAQFQLFGYHDPNSRDETDAHLLLKGSGSKAQLQLTAASPALLRKTSTEEMLPTKNEDYRILKQQSPRKGVFKYFVPPEQGLPECLMMSDSSKRDKLVPPQLMTQCYENVNGDVGLESILGMMETEVAIANFSQPPTVLPTYISAIQAGQPLSRNLAQPADKNADTSALTKEQIGEDSSCSLVKSGDNGKKERPDKNMKKIVFTPFKRLLHKNELKTEYNIDMKDYFEICPNTLYGHRTWMDFEIIFWFVEEKYKHDPTALGRCAKFLNENRGILEQHGQKRYGKPEDAEWLKAYSQCLDSIYDAINQGKDSNDRMRILYGKRRPSGPAVINLHKLQSKFIETGKLSSPSNDIESDCIPTKKCRRTKPN